MLAPQNWLSWQRPLTKVRQILSGIFQSTFYKVNTTIRVAIRPHVVE